MRTDVSKIWPARPEPEVAAVHWTELAGKLGLVVPQERPFLIAIRGVKPFETMSHDLEHRMVYDDTFVLVRVAGAPVVFAGATHAYQKNSKASPDVDRDGLGDVGSIRPGRYVLHDLKHGAEVLFHIRMPDGGASLPAWRDFIDHDGKISAEELQRSESMRTGLQVGTTGTEAQGILFHGGPEEPPEAKHHYSIGCFTAPRKWRKIMSEAAAPYGGKIDMPLITAWDLLPFAEGLTVSPGVEIPKPEHVA